VKSVGDRPGVGPIIGQEVVGEKNRAEALEIKCQPAGVK